MDVVFVHPKLGDTELCELKLVCDDVKIVARGEEIAKQFALYVAAVWCLRAALGDIADMNWPYSPGFTPLPPAVDPHRLIPWEAIELAKMAREALECKC